MGRAPCCDKANVKKGPWSPDEDLKLKNFIETNGTGGNWITLPSKAGLKRCGKSCRLRWINYLRPDIKHGSFTEEEENVIYQLHANLGSRWSLIAAQLPRRTDNDIKNYWNTRLKKKLELGERNMNNHCHQQQRNYHMMPNLATVGQYSGQQNAASMDGFLQQMALPPQYNYPPQQYLTSQVSQRGVPLLPMLSQQKQQQQVLAVKREMAMEQIVPPPYAGGDSMAKLSMLCMAENEATVPPNAVDDPAAVSRLCMIENSLQDCMPMPGDSSCITSSAPPVPFQQSSPAGPMSPVAVEGPRQLSPSSSCTTEVGHGGCGQFAESGIFSGSYDDPTSLVSAQSSVLLSIDDMLPQTQQLANVTPAQKDHSASAAAIPAPSIMDESDSLCLTDEFLRPYPSCDELDQAFEQQLVKQEESMDCWELGDFTKNRTLLTQSIGDVPSMRYCVRKPSGVRVSPSRVMTPQSYSIPPPLCGQGNVFPTLGQTQMGLPVYMPRPSF